MLIYQNNRDILPLSGKGVEGALNRTRLGLLVDD